jgi:hypothetical protein
MYKLLTDDEATRLYLEPDYTLLDACYLLAGYSHNPGYGDMFRDRPANADTPKEINQVYMSIQCALRGSRDAGSLLFKEHGEAFKSFSECKQDSELQAGLNCLNFFAGTKVTQEVLIDFAKRWNQRPAFLFPTERKTQAAAGEEKPVSAAPAAQDTYQRSFRKEARRLFKGGLEKDKGRLPNKPALDAICKAIGDDPKKRISAHVEWLTQEASRLGAKSLRGRKKRE